MEPLRFPEDKISTRAKAFNIIKEKSFSLGDYVLASGKRSKYYLDMKPAMLSPEGATALAELILERIDGLDVHYIGGLEMGAVPLIAPVSMLSYQRRKPVAGFFVRKHVKDHGTMKLIETAGDLRGENVVILEDVTTSGESAMLALKAVKAVDANVVLVLSIVDREEGAAELYAKAGIPFDRLFTTSDFMAV
jgi:orotate phosphoribosyltransferase